MPAGTAALGIGVLFLLVGIVFIFISIYYAIAKTKLTTTQKVLYYGGATVGIILGIVLLTVGGKMNSKALALDEAAEASGTPTV